MPDLDQLIRLAGAKAAFEFSDRGELLDHRVSDGGELDARVLDMVSHVCVANMAIATMQARGWEGLTGQEGFYPIAGCTMLGFDWSTMARGRFGVILENGKCDYQGAYEALGQP